jgi:hypothetical protein
MSANKKRHACLRDAHELRLCEAMINKWCEAISSNINVVWNNRTWKWINISNKLRCNLLVHPPLGTNRV